MAIAKVMLLLLVGLLILSTLVVAIGALLSLDWGRAHRTATNELPDQLPGPTWPLGRPAR